MGKKETILTIGDSIQGPTGFATDLAGVSWCLAKDYDVHILGLQTVQNQKVKIEIEGEKREVFQHANYPRSNQRFDFGVKALPFILDSIQPDILLTVNDIQMINHVPKIMCPNSININVMDLPSKSFIGDEAIQQQLHGEIQKFKENFPRETKWIAYCPQDGDPPMGVWGNVYRMADKTVAMARYGQWVFKRFFNMDVPFIWHGVNTELFKPTGKPDVLKEKFVVGDINRNQPRKQPVRAMEAFAKFAKDKPDVLLHMQMDWNDEFGWPIDYFANMFKIKNKMIQPHQVGVDRKTIAGIYNSWDVNLMPTAGEGFGLPTIEAGACGVPSLHTDYTTGRELLIDGQPSPRGLLIKPIDLIWERMSVAAVRRALIDIDDMTANLNKYYYNRDLVVQHGKNAQEWTKKNCSWKVIEKHWLKTVGETLSGD